MCNDNLVFEKIKNPDVVWGCYDGYIVKTSFGNIGHLTFQEFWAYSPENTSVLVEIDDLKQIIKKLKKLNKKHQRKLDEQAANLGST